jgi:replicative DNA helicase
VNPLLAAALELAQRGLPVFPLLPNSKEPDGQLAPNGYKNASCNHDTITAWWTQHPENNIGIAIPDHLIVVDVDPRNGGADTWAQLSAGRTINTLTSISGRGDGGFHLWLNRIDGPLRTKLGPGVDVKHGGKGYIVAPPSLHPDTGQPYTWADPTATTADPPDWLTRQLAKPAPTPAKTPDLPAPPTRQTVTTDDVRPGDHFTATTTWEQLLTADGWTPVEQHGTEYRWRRPGKTTGISAVVNHTGTDRLKVFTSSVAGLDDQGTYDRFGYWAATRHHGDHTAAAVDLANQGYGTGTQPPDLTWINQTAPPTVNPTTGELTPAPWPDLIPLGEQRNTLPTFPIDTLPTWMGNWCQETAENIQVPVDLPATIGLAALSLACAGHITVQYDDWDSPTNLWLVIAMPPGAGKSPVFKAMTRCIEQHELALAEHMQATVNEAASKQRTIKNRLRKAEEKGDSHEAALIVAELNSHQVPAMPRLIVDDCTIEALVRIIGEQKGRLALLSSEGGLFEQLTGRYNNDSKANLDPYLQAWSGDTIRVDRIGRDSIVAKDATLTIGLTVQPAVLEALGERPELAGRGLTGRFMYSLPADNVGHRDYSRKPKRTETGNRATYEHHIIQLIQQMASYQTPGRLTLDDQAADTYAQWRQQLEIRRRQGGDLRPMSEWSAKLDATLPRLLGLLHVAHGHPHHGLIGSDTLAQAMRIADYWIEHAFAVHDLWGTDIDVAAARTIADWITRHGTTTFTARDIYTAHRRRFPKAKDVEKPLELLAERGWIRPAHTTEIRTGQRGRTITFDVNPAVLQNVQLRAMRAHDQTHPKPGNDEKPAIEPFVQNEVRAMRAMCLDTNLDTHTHSQHDLHATHTNTGGRAHGAHGAQLHDTYQAIIETPEPDLSDLI